MTTLLATRPKEAYSKAVDRKLVDLRKNQGDSFYIAQSIWESISMLESAIKHNVDDLEYDIYFELLQRKVIEFGIANLSVCDMTLREHLEHLEELIELKKHLIVS